MVLAMPLKFTQDGFLAPGIYFEQGDFACAEGAISAGLRFFAGYPITPASEIAEWLAYRLPMRGGVFIQMEDEIASVASLIGASWAGAKVMTATSGPGFSLMQENIGLGYMTETPMVIVDVQRAGPSTGQATKPAQGDIMQMRWGTHGDYASIVVAPNSVQEMFDLTIYAFNLAEEYRMPVIIAADEIVGHLRERLEIPPHDEIKIVNRKKPKSFDEPIFGCESDCCVPPMPAVGEGFNVLVTGSTHNEYGYRKTTDEEVHRKLVQRLINKVEKNKKKIIAYDYNWPEHASVGVISFGSISRSAYTAAKIAKDEFNKNVAHLRLKTIWPFPDELVVEMAELVDYIFVPELNLGKLVREVKKAVEGRAKVLSISRLSGIVTPQDILSNLKRVW